MTQLWHRLRSDTQAIPSHIQGVEPSSGNLQAVCVYIYIYIHVSMYLFSCTCLYTCTSSMLPKAPCTVKGQLSLETLLNFPRGSKYHQYIHRPQSHDIATPLRHKYLPYQYMEPMGSLRPPHGRAPRRADEANR